MNHTARENVLQPATNGAGGLTRARALGYRLTALVALPVISMLLVGCGRGSNESSTNPGANDISGNVSGSQPIGTGDSQPHKLDVSQDSDTSVILDELNREVKKWVMRNRRKPATFEEFSSSAQLEVPPPPPGKKYVLTPELRVELANQ